MTKRKTKVATKREVLEMFTSIMRGEISDCATKRTGGGEETVPTPAKLSDRAHAAELLSKHYGLFSGRSETAAPKTPVAAEVEQLAQQMLREEGRE